MTARLEIDYAFRSEAGVKSKNDDTCNVYLPEDQQLATKGAVAVIADGVSSSEGGGHASQVCVSSFISDYYSTPESWTVKTSTGKILGALNRWLYNQGQNLYDSVQGMVTTFSGMVIKSTTAHIMHIGDSRIYRYRNGNLEQLTRDHRVWMSNNREFLSRAMGADINIDIDYKAIDIKTDDIFLFSTDGVHDFLTNTELKDILQPQIINLQVAANQMVETALNNSSNDNVSVQLIKILQLPEESDAERLKRIADLPFPPDLKPGMKIDGYQIIRELHASSRSEVFLALEMDSGNKVVLKTPSINYRDDPDYIDAFLHEEWVGRRINNAHVLRILDPVDRRFLYNVTEYVEAQSLGQWIGDNTPVDMQQMRSVAEQIANGLRALHRLEMVHQDLKPDNILIDKHGTIKLIDFGSTRIAGLEEIHNNSGKVTPQGTLNYAAPECLRGERCSFASDLFSLGTILYEMLTSKLPYGESDTPQLRKHLTYTSARIYNQEIPTWVDAALEKAVHPNPARRYDTLSEFLQDLKRPSPNFIDPSELPLLERNPVRFWQTVSVIMVLLNLLLAYLLISS